MIIYKSKNTFYFSIKKTYKESLDKHCVVYKIPCSDCNSCYTGLNLTSL